MCFLKQGLTSHTFKMVIVIFSKFKLYFSYYLFTWNIVFIKNTLKENSKVIRNLVMIYSIELFSFSFFF